MRRGNVSIRDVASEADDGWIWGNNRGGGGAPLKDREGKSLTNLKLVLAGDVKKVITFVNLKTQQNFIHFLADGQNHEDDVHGEILFLN